MTFPENRQYQLKPLFLILALLILCRILFVGLMPATYSKDLFAWLNVIDLLKNGENPYKSGVLNWPPVWMQLLYGIGRIADWTGISAIHLIQSVLVTGECMVVILTYAILKRLDIKGKIIRGLLISWVINPICIFLSCQHCNFDIFVGFWILLFIYLMLSYFKDIEVYYWLAACFCLGMGILTKTIPFVLSPLLLMGFRKRKSGLNFFGLLLLLMPVSIAMSVIYVLGPDAVSENVLSYRSMAGWYGITGMMNVMGQFKLLEWYRSLSPFLILGMMGWTAYCIYPKERLSAQQLVVLVLTILVFLPTFGPGYTPPYILWYLAVAIIYFFNASRSTKTLLIVGLIVLVLDYTFEYALFNSHGSFIKYFISTETMAAFCEKAGQSAQQSLIRIPMFVFYLSVFVALLKDKNNILTHKNEENPFQLSS